MNILHILGILQLTTGLPVIYNKYISDRASDDFKVKSMTISTIGGCMLFCKEIEVMSVGYNAGDGKCTCHSALPETLSLTPSPGTNIYDCRVAVTLGYLYEHGANLCYKVHHTRRQWVAAKVECENEGAILIKADPAPVMQIVKAIVAENAIDFYIGGSKDSDNGVWRWLKDNSTVPGFSLSGTKYCLELRATSLILEDSGCSNSQQKFICEIPLA